MPLGAIIGAGTALYGALTAKQRAEQQREQQEKLMDKAYQQNKGMAMFNQEQQMKMWEATGPVGQMEQLKKAGLNPGLIYGMGGAGGQTAGAAQGGSASTPSAPMPESGAEFGGMAMQLASMLNLQKAQKENIEADTEKKKAEVKETIEGKLPNIQAETELKKLETTFADGTLENRIAQVANTTSTVAAQMKSAIAQGNIDASTQEAKIDEITETAIGAMLNNIQTKQQTAESQARIKKMAQDIAQAWKGLNQQAAKIAIDQQLANLKAEFPDLDNVMARDIRAGLDKLWEIMNPLHKREELSKDYKQHNK